MGGGEAGQTWSSIDCEFALWLVACALGTVVVVLLSITLAWWAYYSRKRRSFNGAVCCVIGAGKGIGQAVCETLAQRGARAIILVDVDTCAETETILRKAGVPKIVPIKCDITKEDQVAELEGKVGSEFNKVDLVVNCAGVLTGKSFLDTSVAEFKRVIDVNLVGHFAMMKLFLPPMLKANEGCFVGVSSLMGLMTGAKLSDYCASKFGVVGLFESLRMELGHRYNKVSLVCVCPYAVNTGMFDGIFEANWRTKLIRTIFPLLEPSSCAESIVLAAERGTSVAVVPFFFAPLINIVRCLPDPLYEIMLELMGGADGMEAYKGHSNVWGTSQ